MRIPCEDSEQGLADSLPGTTGELLMSRAMAIRHLCQCGGGPKYQVPADVTGAPIEENWRNNEPPG
jgi:hypothetical protein